MKHDQPSDAQRERFETAVVDRLKENGFLEIEIRTECLMKDGSGAYQDEVINAGWHYWNAALAGMPSEPVATSEGSEWLTDGRLTPDEAWTILCETPDITSPEEHPDHALITLEQLRGFMERSATMSGEPVDAPVVAPLLGTRFKLSFNRSGNCTTFRRDQADQLDGEWVWLIEATNGMNDPLYLAPPARPATMVRPSRKYFDYWGAEEWFDRLARAVRRHDGAMESESYSADSLVRTFKSEIMSSALRLVREFEPDVRTALAGKIEYEKLRRALRPFARFCSKAEQFVEEAARSGGSPILPTNEFRLEDFRRARSAWEGDDA